MADKTYRLQGVALGADAGFDNGKVFINAIGNKHEVPFIDLKEVIVKKTPMSAGDEISIRLVYIKDGSDKKTGWVQAKVADADTREFVADLKSRIPDTVIWTDKREAAKTNEAGQKVYDLQFLPFGYAGAGLPRAGQIWIYLICTAVLILPLIYFIYLLAKGGYRIYTDDNGLTIRKTGDTRFSWNDIKGVEVTRVKVVDQQNFTSADVLKLHFKGAKNKSVVMRYAQAAPLLKELGQRGVMSQDLVDELT